jgi:hypothetical protein
MKNGSPRSIPWLVAVTVALAAFIEVLDSSIANVALPHIAGNLGASQDQATRVVPGADLEDAAGCWIGAMASKQWDPRMSPERFIVQISINALATLGADQLTKQQSQEVAPTIERESLKFRRLEAA